jgi:hypothetical protein
MRGDRDRARRKRLRYPRSHTLTQRALAPAARAGLLTCPRCGRRILPGEAFDLDHRDDGKGYLGMSHASCNRSAGGKRRHEKGPGPSREWLAW